MNYEIYTGKVKDKIDCPQKTKLFDKKEFVHSVLYPHHSLNFSMQDDKKEESKKEESRFKVEKALKVKTSG